MIETWIDALCDVWAMVAVDGFRTMKSPYLIKESKFPAAISPADDFPIAITIPANVDLEYSVGGPKIAHFTGVTQFHLTPDLSMAHIPTLLPYYNRIWVAAAANLKLGGLVEYFIIPKPNSITGPIALKWGDEAEHWGFLVNWEVKDKSNTTVVVGDSSVK